MTDGGISRWKTKCESLIQEWEDLEAFLASDQQTIWSEPLPLFPDDPAPADLTATSTRNLQNVLRALENSMTAQHSNLEPE